MSFDTTLALPVERTKTRLIPAVGFILFTLSWFAILGMRALYDPDEGRYAEIPREMLLTGQWVIPHLNGLAYLEKPPLQYWLTALSFRFFGETEFAARLWTGLSGYWCLIFAYLLARRLWGRRAAYRVALLMLGSTLFTLLAHQITLDMSLTFWLFAALACFIQAQLLRDRLSQNRRWMLGCWIAMAAAVLTKGLIGALIPVMTLILYSILQRDYLVYDRLNLRWGLPAFVAVAAPWFVLAAHDNAAFLNFFFVREHVERYLTTISQRVEPWWFFIGVLIVGVLPWLPQALRAIATDWRARESPGQFDPVRLLWVWVVFILLFFSVSDSKLVPYILPAVPALALLCARRDPRADGRALRIGSTLSLLSALGIGVYALWPGPAPAADTIATAFRAPLLAMAVCIVVGSALGLHLLLRVRHQTALAALCLGWLVGTSLLLAGGSPGDRHFSSRELAAVLHQRLQAQDPVFSVACYDQTLTYYLRRPVTLAAYRGELDLGLTQAPQRGIDTLDQFAARWRALTQGYAVMHPRTFDSLRAARLPLVEIARSPTLVVASRR